MRDGPSLLADFMERNELKQADVARALNVKPPYVHEWLMRKKRPGEVFRLYIERFTRGAVPSSAWLTDAERAAVKAVTPLKQGAA